MSGGVYGLKTIAPTGDPVGALFICKSILDYLSAACAAARRAIGTRKGEQDT